MTATRQPDIPREQQVAETMAISAMLYDQGWRKISIRLTGRTVQIDAEAADGDKVAGPQFRRRAG